uniref:AIG1-type G domain-containing protein n=1 Tax=Cyprinus carpio TaxID=7962 RepID=A0A8C2FPG9_CYPCA
MADSPERQKTEPEFSKFDAIIKESIVIEEGTPTRYHLKLRTDSRDPSEPYIKVTYGERDTEKPHKTILLVGEAGIGKTKLINVMINYMLGVKREDKVWFEITDDQSDRTSVHSQTSSITVYEFYLQESPIHLTIIDTPGYGDTRRIEKDKEIAESLLYLCKEVILEIHAVCLVIKATQTRISDRQIYIFDAVQSLFGRDIADNIILLLTHSRGAVPKNILTAVKEAKIKCAVKEQNQPVYFLFDNCQSEPAAETNEMLKQSWDLTFTEIKGFFELLENIKAKTLKMTQDVLKERKDLEANISNLQTHNQKMDPKQNELKQVQEALEQNKKVAEENKNFEYEVEVTYKEKVDIDPAVAKTAMCCTVCEENCHYPGYSRVSDLLWCSAMRKNHCTVCTNKCHCSKHIEEAKIYEKKTKREKKTNEESKKIYNDSIIKIKEGESVVKKLEQELQKLEIEKVKLVMEAYHCVNTLEKIALNTDSLLTLQYVDFLIEKLKEISEPGKAETLENIKKRAGEEKNEVLKYMKIHVESDIVNSEGVFL